MRVWAASPKKKFLVVIDAGHGGKDTGAIENDVKEKDINLAVARKLGELITKKLKDTEVIYTRTNDSFLSLQQRADIANNAKADLFISIHCNSVDKSNQNRSNVQGATTYVLGRHKDADNLAVAKRENSVVELDADDSSHYAQYDDSQDESHIIFEMTQKKNFQNSIRFARDVQSEMISAGRYSRGVQQAGFWVLWSTAMPAALIELDFICNPEQAKFLSSTAGQDKLANAIFKAVKSYESYFRKSLGSGETAGYDPEDNFEMAETSAAKKQGAASSGSTDMAELPASTEEPSKRRHRDSKVNAPSTRQASTSSHRRRSSRAREEGASKVGETVIAMADEPAGKADAATADDDDSGNKGSSKKSDAKTSKKDKDKKKSDKSKPARREKDNKRKNLRQNVHIVYKILLFTSGEELKANDPAFKGLSPVASFRENNMYKYTYLESADRLEMEAKLAEIKEIFPEAYLIRIIN